ncbi:unnamed protein product [Heligmosomoides polygyrus]|uniref:Protein asunder n=1 Tax=Heligmosomoides polygyrus TaxID=6339 RepID=A0A183GJQ7_HELPZ|nr:unnamed protein product [Heligmosomoides polygyrus]
MGLGLDHKVLVVLDHGPRFARRSGNVSEMPVGKSDKSLWTWCVEATLELHRTDCVRLMRFVLADCVGRVLQSQWGTELVTQQEVGIEIRRNVDMPVGIVGCLQHRQDSIAHAYALLKTRGRVHQSYCKKPIVVALRPCFLVCVVWKEPTFWAATTYFHRGFFHFGLL